VHTGGATNMGKRLEKGTREKKYNLL